MILSLSLSLNRKVNNAYDVNYYVFTERNKSANFIDQLENVFRWNWVLGMLVEIKEENILCVMCVARDTSRSH